MEGGWTGGELALFYRKGLIALPITDNATINDLREVGLGRSGEGRKGQEGGGTGTWSRMGMRLGIWETRMEEEEVVVGARKRETEKQEAKHAYRYIHTHTRAFLRRQTRAMWMERGTKCATVRELRVGSLVRGWSVEEDGSVACAVSPKGTDWLSTCPVYLCVYGLHTLSVKGRDYE